MTPEDMDENYMLLSQTRWKGIAKQPIAWSREGDAAVATFNNTLDADMFIHGYLPGWRAIMAGMEDVLPQETPAQAQIEKLQSPQGLKPVTVRIPLHVLRTENLTAMLARETAEWQMQSPEP